MAQKSKKRLPAVRAATPAALIGDIRRMIEETRSAVATAVNAGLTTLYWRIGTRIRREVLQQKRAEYGQEIVATLSRQLEADYGSGFSEKNIRHMVRFAEAFPDERIVSALRRELSWTHFRAIIYIDDPIKRDFYAEMCRVERWSTRALQKKIDSMLFERTALSRKPEQLVRHELDRLRATDQISPDLIFKDPYFLEFLGLKDRYLERDLEDAILRQMEAFLLELGAGFAFLARQKRIQIDTDDFCLDLLFFNRHLNRLVVIDLKLGEFKPEYKGKMELYLRWLDKHERRPAEESPMGIILCAGRRREQIELLELDRSGIHVAEYLTDLPSKEVLKKKLHLAVQQAKAQLEHRGKPAEEPGHGE